MPFPLWLIPTILSGAQTLSGLFGRRKKPKAPDLPRMSDFTLSPESEEMMLGALRRRIGEGKQGALESVRTNALQRGFYRSGQLPALEGKVEGAAQRDYSDAVAKLEEDKVNRRMNFAQLIARIKEGRYAADMGEYSSGEEGAGSMFGGGLSNLLRILEMYGQGKKTNSNKKDFKIV